MNEATSNAEAKRKKPQYLSIRNRGLLGADDLLTPEKIERQLSALRAGDSRRSLLSSQWAPRQFGALTGTGYRSLDEQTQDRWLRATDDLPHQIPPLEVLGSLNREHRQLASNRAENARCLITERDEKSPRERIGVIAKLPNREAVISMDGLVLSTVSDNCESERLTELLEEVLRHSEIEFGQPFGQ